MQCWRPGVQPGRKLNYTVQNLYDFLSGYALARDPGAQWEYSNLGMSVLGQALVLQTGLDYETLVTQRIHRTGFGRYMHHADAGSAVPVGPGKRWNRPQASG